MPLFKMYNFVIFFINSQIFVPSLHSNFRIFPHPQGKCYMLPQHSTFFLPPTPTPLSPNPWKPKLLSASMKRNVLDTSSEWHHTTCTFDFWFLLCNIMLSRLIHGHSFSWPNNITIMDTQNFVHPFTDWWTLFEYYEYCHYGHFLYKFEYGYIFYSFRFMHT